MDEMEYLQPSFDPSSLTMPRLRNILMTHNIQYPASAKKAQLVDSFNQDLKPQARKLLSARDRVRRTSKGITDMPSSQEGTVDGEEEETRSSLPPPPTPRAQVSRKSVRSSAEDPLSEEALPVKRTLGSKQSSQKHPRHSDMGTDPGLPIPAKKGRPRGSEAIARVKVEENEEEPVRSSVPKTAFSDENPFQSGSSPLTLETNRRRSAATTGERRKSSSSRRKTEGTPSTRIKEEDGIMAPKSRTFEMPVSALRKPEDEHNDSIEAGEEFAPEELLELARQRAAKGEKRILGPRVFRRHKKSAIPKSAPWLVLSALLVGYGTWYRQEKLSVGYCGIGRPSYALSNLQVLQWATSFVPTCEPCPQHATCYEGMETQCEHDFVLQPHPLSLAGMVPFPPSCEPDGAKVRRVKTVSDRAVETLRERRAQAECGILKDEIGKDISAEIPEQELKKDVGKNRNRAMSEQEFEDLWKDAIGEIVGREEVISSDDGRLLSSTSLASLSIACAVRRSARLALARNKQSISLVILFLSLVAYARNRILTSRADTARVPSLVATTLDRLATQAALQARGDAAESWISVGQLRDDVLRDVFSDKRRESIWIRVRAVVERNANVRASVRERRGGDVSRVWEWIGSIGLIDQQYSDRRSGGKRVSFGGLVEDGTPDGRPLSPEQGEGGVASDKLVEQRRWDEGRPIC